MPKSLKCLFTAMLVVAVVVAGFALVHILQNDINHVAADGLSSTSDIAEEYMTGELDQLITKTIDEPLMTPAMFNGTYLWGKSCAIVSLDQIKNAYPVELTHKINDNTMYVVFRQVDPNIGTYYTYVFFRRANQDEMPPDYKPASEDALWSTAGMELRISKRLFAKDFEGITMGATIKQVAAIDPITSISLPKGDDLGADNPILKFDTFHYTEDGIVRISFSRKSVSDPFLVSDIACNKTFEVHPLFGADFGKDLALLKLKINSEHLPD
ncbi:MAG: hypothetical protein ACOYH4_03085 [Saccharofermentanales bacterium]|jgi:hypothetical protein